MVIARLQAWHENWCRPGTKTGVARKLVVIARLQAWHENFYGTKTFTDQLTSSARKVVGNACRSCHETGGLKKDRRNGEREGDSITSLLDDAYQTWYGRRASGADQSSFAGKVFPAGERQGAGAGLAQGPAGRGTPDHWRGHQDGAMGLALGDAAGKAVGEGALRSPLGPADPHCPSPFRRPRRDYRPAARLLQDDPDDPGRASQDGPAEKGEIG